MVTSMQTAQAHPQNINVQFPMGEEELSAAFARDDLVRLPGLFPTPLLEILRKHERRAEYTHIDTLLNGTHMRESYTPVPYFLHLMLNEPAFLDRIGRILRHPEVRRFRCRLYRVDPGDSHCDWHCDSTKGLGRMAGLTVNLGKAFEGGELRLRRRGQEPHAMVHNIGEGDAVLFKIDPTFQHKVEGVRGSVPKLSLAGWFSP